MTRLSRCARALFAAAALALVAAAPARAQDEAGFQAWLQQFRTEARQEGIKPELLDRAFGAARFNERVIELDRFQPEFTKPIHEYIAGVVTEDAVRRGRLKLREHAALLERVRQRYGVPPEYVVAIWRVESGFGSNFGSFNVVESLATLAYAGRRQPFWKAELLAALRLADSGEVPLERLVGSWAGALGNTQFMPTVYLSKAVDFDGDGKRDLWRSLPDVFASTANYLKLAGWQPGMPFGIEVQLPGEFAYELTETTTKPVAEWARLGIARIGGGALPNWPGEAAILIPAGHRGPAFLVSANFKAILDYNNAAAYALSVGLFAERLKGSGTLVRAWPTGDRVLSRTEKEELQKLLAERGFDPGPVDGFVGPGTRTAIRAFQKKAGVPADGYADTALLDLIRKSPKP